MSFNFDNQVKNLPDAYAKTNDSNNAKILQIEHDEIQKIRVEITDLEECLDINNAFGKTLDYYGDTVGQPRGVATDEQYRPMILTKIMHNLSNGTYPSVINAICNIFNCQPSDVVIVENSNPCAVDVVKLPLSKIIASNFTPKQTTQLIKRLLPIGIVVDTYLFEGTFEFSDQEYEYDEEKGFSDDNGTIGGYFGVLYSKEDEEELPI